MEGTIMQTPIPAMNTLEYELDERGVGWLRFNRPERLNAWNSEMWREMGALGNRLVNDSSIRALVVTGNGRAFSSGIDTATFAEGTLNPAALAATSSEDVSRRHENPTTNMILEVASTYAWLADAPFPTIAAVQGYAFGAGLQVALACDIRVFAHGAVVGLLEHKYGMLPDLGGTQRLPRLVGPAKAKHMIWTSAKIDSEEALRIGLCEQTVPHEELEETVSELAGIIAAQPPLAVQGTKRAVRAALNEPIETGAMIEALEQTTCLESEDFREAIGAFIEGRPPVYSAR